MSSMPVKLCFPSSKIVYLFKEILNNEGDMEMTKPTKPILTASLILTITLLINFVGLDIANACGCGQGGGQGYVPQRRDQNGYLAQKQPLTQEQARDVVTNYVKKLNSKQ